MTLGQLLRIYKNLNNTEQKHRNVASDTMRQIGRVGVEIRRLLGEKLADMRDDSPLRKYTWTATYQTIYASPGVEYLGIRLYANEMRRSRNGDPLTRFFGDSVMMLRYHSIPLEDGVILYHNGTLWQLRFYKGANTGDFVGMPPEEIRAFVARRKLRVKLNPEEAEEYSKAKKTVAEYEELVSLFGRELK
jgi:hypothetical protein